ncbi:phthiocerol/phthiodiolone dimycocerosyl transferase family protein [Pseudonocardia sp. HH130630-07]|uniref:phthiocerol/phthiodiolone dimycocerosyl transferase family protein n=1 Tax=Pseudonocardia sp. HH130630-07 TaxID=1690815 RepID=UPI000814B648|nr:hypothetical protein [Pseudonocardia sp. HH130630-07]ANY07760.1 hypothetical protein AFB00_17310 [Pseudonocardia sp. HH130630-07]
MDPRPLSPLERWYDVADRISPLNVVGRLTVHGPVTVPALRDGLDAVQRTHPLTRVAVGGDGPRPRFVPARAPVPLRVLTGDREPGVVEDELARRIDSRTGPLLRAAVVLAEDGSGADLVLTAAHSIADGTTVLSLLQEWVERAAGTTAPARPGVRPTEELFPAPARGRPGAAAARAKAGRDHADLARHRPARVEADRIVPHASRRTGLVRREIAGPALSALVIACRAAGVSVHGLLGGTLARVVARESPGAGCMVLGSPVDFRADLEPPVDRHEVGSFVATLPTVVDTTGDPWDAAAAIGDDLAARRARGEHFSMITELGRAAPATPDAAGPFLDRLDREGPINLCLTNLGVCAVPDRIGPWDVSGARFAAGISVVGLLVAAVTTHRGVLSIDLTHVEDAVPAARAARIADGWLDELTGLVAARRPIAAPAGVAR